MYTRFLKKWRGVGSFQDILPGKENKNNVLIDYYLIILSFIFYRYIRAQKSNEKLQENTPKNLKKKSQEMW
jgi:hypothetical protein